MLFAGDDWAEDHHDIEIVGEDGRRLARRRLPEGLAGIAQLPALIAGFVPEEWADLPPGEAARQVKAGTGTGRGPWVAALVAAGYEVFPVNPMSVARYRERHSTSGATRDSHRHPATPAYDTSAAPARFTPLTARMAAPNVPLCRGRLDRWAVSAPLRKRS